MTKHKKLSAILLGAILALGVGAGLGASRVEVGKAAEETISLTNIGTDAPSSANTTIAQLTVNGYELNYYQVKKISNGQNHAMLLTKSVSPFVGNKTPIPGHIKSIDVKTNPGSSGSTAYHVHFSSTEFAAPGSGGTAVVIGADVSRTFTNSNTSGDKYFAISLGNNNHGQVQNITIKYEVGGTVDPDPEFGALTSIAIKTPATKTSFRTGETFSSAGLVLTASDDSDPVITKDITSGFTTDLDGLVFDNSHIGTLQVEITYEEDGAEAYQYYDIEVSEAPFEPTTTYGGSGSTPTLVTSASALSAGDKIVIASKDKSTTAGNLNGKFLEKIDSTFSGDKTKITSMGAGTMVFTLGGTSGSWTLANPTGDLLGEVVLKELSFTKEGRSTSWKIDIDENYNATIYTGESPASGRFLYNNNAGQERFLTYTSELSEDKMLMPQIYEMDGAAGGYNYDYLLDVLKGGYCEMDVEGLDLIETRYEAMTPIEKSHFGSESILGNDGQTYTGDQAYNIAMAKRAALSAPTLKNPFTDTFETNEIFMILVIISLIGVSVVGASLFIFKRKEK